MSGKKVATWDAKTRQIYKRLLGYTARHRTVGLLAILGMAVDGAGLAAFTKLMPQMIDGLLTKHEAYLVFWMPIWIILIFVIRGIATFVSSYGVSYVGRNVVQAMQRDVFGAYLKLPAAFFGAENSGYQISRITYTSEQVSSAATDAIKVAVTEGVTVIGFFYVMLSTSMYLSLALFIMVPAIMWIAAVVSRRYRTISRNIQSMMGSVTGTVEESVSANREIRIYGGQQQADKRFEEVTDRARRLNLKIAATNAQASSAIQTVASLALAGMVILATVPGHPITAGIFITVLTAMGGMLPSLKRLANVQSNIQTGMSAAENLFEIIDTAPEVDAGTREIERAWGDLRFEGVRLVYPKKRFRSAARCGSALRARHGDGAGGPLRQW